MVKISNFLNDNKATKLLDFFKGISIINISIFKQLIAHVSEMFYQFMFPTRRI